MAEQKLRFKVWALALTGGIMWTFCVVMVGLGAHVFNWGVALRDLISSLYIGFDRGGVGILMGALWAFPDAFILLAIFGLVYNAFVGKPKTES